MSLLNTQEQSSGLIYFGLLSKTAVFGLWLSVFPACGSRLARTAVTEEIKHSIVAANLIGKPNTLPICEADFGKLYLRVREQKQHLISPVFLLTIASVCGLQYMSWNFGHIPDKSNTVNKDGRQKTCNFLCHFCLFIGFDGTHEQTHVRCLCDGNDIKLEAKHESLTQYFLIF